MKEIFEEIDRIKDSHNERFMLGRFDYAFLSRQSVIIEKLLPFIDNIFTNKGFQHRVMRTYTEECIHEKQKLIKELHARREHPDAVIFYTVQIESIDKKLALSTFDQLIEYLNGYLDEYPGSLDVFNIYYKTINTSDGIQYIKNNYVNYFIGYLLYREHQAIRNRTDLLNIKYADIVSSEYKSIGINLENEDSQFSKYKLVSLTENIKIINNKDSQTIYDKRIDKYFWINIPRNLLKHIELLIEQEIICKISFRVDYISECLPIMEDKEFGSKMELKISCLPALSKFYSTDNYYNNLWIQHDHKKQSLTFEELLDEFEIADDNVVTQVIHLEYTSVDENFFITHLDHEFIIYTIDQYEERISNAGQKGYKKIKTFKVDESMIPFDLRLDGNLFLAQVLDSFFNNKGLIEEYFDSVLSSVKEPAAT